MPRRRFSDVAVGQTSRAGRLQPGGRRRTFADVPITREAPPPRAKKKGDGGWFGHIPGADIVERGAADFYHAAVGAPAGIYELGRGVVTDIRRHPEDILTVPALTRARKSKAAKAYARQVREEVAHPLRHPGLTLLDLTAALSVGAGTVARVGEAGRLVRAGAAPGEVGRGLALGPRPGTIGLRVPAREGGVLEARVPASRSALGRLAQSQLNDLRNAFPNRRLGVLTQYQRVQRATRRGAEIREAGRTAKARELGYRGRTITAFRPRGLALRAVAEETPLETIQDAWRAARDATADPQIIRRLDKRIALAERAKKYVTIEEGGLRLFRGSHPRESAIRVEDGPLFATTDKATAQNYALNRLGSAGQVLELQLRKDAKVLYPTRNEVQSTGMTEMLERGRREGYDAIVFPDQRWEGVAILNDRAIHRPTPQIRAEHSKLAALSDLARDVSRENDISLVEDLGYDMEHLQRAVSAPGRYYRGAKYVQPTKARLGIPTQREIADQARVDRLQTLFDRASPGPTKERLGGALSVAKDELATTKKRAAGRVRPTGIVGAEEFAAEGGYHVGMPIRQPLIGGFGGVREGQVMNVGAQMRGGLRAPLTGRAITTGMARHDVPRIVMENVASDQRAITRMELGQQYYDAAFDTPEGMRNPQAIRDPALFGRETPAPVREAMDAAARGELADAQKGILASADEAIREHLFPDEATSDQMAALADVEPIEGYRWVERQLVDDLARPPAGVQTKGGRTALAFADAVNNASKMAILYLKPAYAVPNMVGNSFLTLVQQGFAAPKNIARAVTMHKAIGAHDTVLIDTHMGEGLSASLRGVGAGPLAKATQFGARGWGALVDLPFRRASFLYEANKVGYRSAAEVKQLLHSKDPQVMADLEEVVQRANTSLIDYSNLTPFEQSFVRRIFFFYPWLKGSTRYAKDFLRDHPMQAALLANVGARGYETETAALGPVPSWYQGIFPVGGTAAQPLTINPTAAGILSQPVQLGAIAAKTAGLPVHGGAYDLAELLTPVLGAGVGALAGQDPLGRERPRTFGTFVQNLYGGWPGVTLYQRLTEDQRLKAQPMTPRDALMRFLIGGLWPTPTDVARLHRQARRDIQR